jgi:hypothetical protein
METVGGNSIWKSRDLHIAQRGRRAAYGTRSIRSDNESRPRRKPVGF